MCDLVVSPKFLEYGVWVRVLTSALFFAQCGCGSCESEIGCCAGVVAARMLGVGPTGHG
jgi:hypothetical protein